MTFLHDYSVKKKKGSSLAQLDKLTLRSNPLSTFCPSSPQSHPQAQFLTCYVLFSAPHHLDLNSFIYGVSSPAPETGLDMKYLRWICCMNWDSPVHLLPVIFTSLWCGALAKFEWVHFLYSSKWTKPLTCADGVCFQLYFHKWLQTIPCADRWNT